MDLAIMEKQIKEYCEQHIDKMGARMIRKMKLIKFDESLKEATFLAEDACDLCYIQSHDSNELVAALESITGQPSHVECLAKREPLKPVHKRFTIVRTEPGDGYADSGPSLPERIDKLEQQVASLQAKLESFISSASALSGL